MDINMPIMDGIEATKHIRVFCDRLKLETKVVALTGFCNDRLQKKAKDFGFIEVISKPITCGKLEKVLRANYS